MSHTFVWIDIPVADLGRAIAFYGAVTGRPLEKVEGPGFTFGLFRHQGNEVAGCLVPADGLAQPSLHGPLVYLDVTGRLDAAVAAAQAAGGKVLQARHSIGPHGWRAVVADSEGNRIALHSPTA
jgi:predicted enzyme related to lactoylglutathione lyase